MGNPYTDALERVTEAHHRWHERYAFVKDCEMCRIISEEWSNHYA